MKHSKVRRRDPVSARFEAEDRAVDYLAKFPPEIAFATAIEVEAFLAQQWAEQQTEMLQRGEEVFQISDEDFQRIGEARGMVPPGGKVHIEALHHILRFVTGLRADEKWKVASSIAFRMAVRAVLPDGLLEPYSGPQTTELMSIQRECAK